MCLLSHVLPAGLMREVDKHKADRSIAGGRSRCKVKAGFEKGHSTWTSTAGQMRQLNCCATTAESLKLQVSLSALEPIPGPALPPATGLIDSVSRMHKCNTNPPAQQQQPSSAVDEMQTQAQRIAQHLMHWSMILAHSTVYIVLQ